MSGSEIVGNFLYISDAAYAQAFKNKYHCVINCAYEVNDDNVTLHLPFKEVHYDYDSWKSMMDEALDKVIKARETNHNALVLIHCLAGINRSATICAYILFTIWQGNWSMNNVFRYLQSKRGIIHPNLENYAYLLRYEKEFYEQRKNSILSSH